MIYQYSGYQIEVKIDRQFKSRVRAYVKLVYKLALTPSNKKLKELFPGYSDLRLNVNWLHIMRITEDKQAYDEKLEQKMNNQNIANNIDNTLFTYTRTGLIRKANNETFMGYSWDLYDTNTNSYLGTVGYNNMRQGYYTKKLKSSLPIYNENLETAIKELLSHSRNKQIKTLAA